MTANRWLAGRSVDPEQYDAHYEERAARGEDVHGEANLVMWLLEEQRPNHAGPAAALDAGCGTGRVARELARRGCEVTGADIDEAMLAVGRRKAPALDWRLGDLATLDLGRRYDLAVMAGNVILFVAPGTEGAVLANLARHLLPGGLLVAGFRLTDGLTLAQYDDLAVAAGLAPVARWSTWERDPWRDGGDYAVSVHRAPAS